MAGVDPTPHDDRAWPRGAIPLSLIIGLGALAAGVAVAVNEERPLVPALYLLAGLLVGSALIITGIRRWLSGATFPAGLGLIASVVAVAALIFATRIHGGIALLAGLVGGCMLANVWAVRAARANPTPPTS